MSGFCPKLFVTQRGQVHTCVCGIDTESGQPCVSTQLRYRWVRNPLSGDELRLYRCEVCGSRVCGNDRTPLNSEIFVTFCNLLYPFVTFCNLF